MSIKKQSEQQIYGRNDMIMLEQNNKIYGSLGLADRYVMKTEEGTRLILSNPKLGSFDDVLTEFNIYGMSKQVTTTGAQLLNIEPKETTVENGIVYRINYDGTIELSGTATVNTYVLVATLDESLDGKTAFLSGAVTDKVFIGITDLEDDGTTVADLGDGASFTFVENGTTKYVGISVNSGTTVNNIIKPMLNLGTTAKPWEKYTGGMPAPNPDYPQEIVSVGQKLSTGKNLINADDYYSEYKQTDGMYKVDDVKLNDITIIFDSSMVGKTYTASCNLNCPNTVSSVVLEANIDGKKVLGNIIPTNKSAISKVTFTPKTVRDSIKITYGTGRGDIIFSDFQIEAGSFATSYEPYTGGVPALYQKDIEARVTGKNLFGGKAFADKIVELGGTLQESDKTVHISANNIRNKEVFVFPDNSKQYTLIFNGKNTVSGTFINMCIVYTDGTRTNLNFVDNKKLILTTYKDKKIINLMGMWQDGEVSFYYDKCGIFEGVLTETDFKPYEYQSLPIATPTGLPAISVPSGTSGITYTDTDGQAWIADEIDFSRGKYIQRVWKGVFDGSSDEEWSEHWREGTYTTRIKWSDLVLPRKILCNQYICGNGIGQFDSLLDNGQLHLYFNYDNGTIGMDAFKALIASNPIKVMTYLNTPIETDLTQEEIKDYQSLVTYDGTTIVENDAECYTKITYMAKGN